MVEIYKLFDLSKTIAKDYLSKIEYPWKALSGIADAIITLGQALCKEEYKEIKPHVWVHKDAAVFSTAFIEAPCIIDKDAQVRHCAFIRGSAIVGKNCVVGNSVEIKNSILFDQVQVPHFNYVGDSILGFKSHFGAGAITSNLKLSKGKVFVSEVRCKDYTGLTKVGAFVGDYVQVGCNSVLNPGCVVGKNTIIYPLCSVRGYVAPNKIYKSKDEIVERLDY